MNAKPISIAVTGQALIETPLDVESSIARPVQDFFAGADLGFTNFEACVEAPGAWPTKTKTLHAATPDVLVSLRKLGVNAVGHANNHAFDLGPPGAASSRAAAERADIAFAGSGASLSEASGPGIRETKAGPVAVIAADLGPQQEIVYASDKRAGINPLRMRRVVSAPAQDLAVLRNLAEQLGDAQLQRTRAAIGMRDQMAGEGIELFGTNVIEGPAIASHQKPNTADLARVRKSIEDAHGRGALTVVSLHSHHWQADWTEIPNWFADLSRYLVEAGADVIVGTGAPVLQRILFHKGKPIFAGLGNFIFHTKRLTEYDDQGIDVWSGAVCRCRFGADRSCEKIEVMPIAAGRIAVDGGKPQAPTRLPQKESAAVVKAMTAALPEDQRVLITLA